LPQDAVSDYGVGFETVRITSRHRESGITSVFDGYTDALQNRTSLPPAPKQSPPRSPPPQAPLRQAGPLQLRVYITFAQAVACMLNPASYDTVELQHVFRRNVKRWVGQSVIADLECL